MYGDAVGDRNMSDSCRRVGVGQAVDRCHSVYARVGTCMASSIFVPCHKGAAAHKL